MPTNAEIKALINTRVRAQRSHILNNGVAEILDFMVDNIAAGGGGVPGLDDVLAVGQALTEDREIDLAGHTYEYHNGNWYVDIGANFLAYIQNGDNNYLGYYSAHSSLIRASYQPLVGDINAASVEVTADEQEGMAVLRAIFNQGATEAKIEAIARDGETTFGYGADKHTFNTGGANDILFIINSLQNFADNAAALAGGIPNNGLYYTNTGGERFLKIANE